MRRDDRRSHRLLRVHRLPCHDQGILGRRGQRHPEGAFTFPPFFCSVVYFPPLGEERSHLWVKCCLFSCLFDAHLTFRLAFLFAFRARPFFFHFAPHLSSCLGPQCRRGSRALPAGPGRGARKPHLHHEGVQRTAFSRDYASRLMCFCLGFKSSLPISVAFVFSHTEGGSCV